MNILSTNSNTQSSQATLKSPLSCSLTALRWLIIVSCLQITACSSLIQKPVQQFSDNLSNSFINSNDPETVAAALPSFIFVSESLARNDASNVGANLGTAKLYSTYAGSFVSDNDRQRALSQRGFYYAQRAACAYHDDLCELQKLKLTDLKQLSWKSKDLPLIYQVSVSWLGFIQTHANDWRIVAQLPRVKYLLEQSLLLDEEYDNGTAHLYLGAIATLIPPALGGKPEIGKQHFESAIAISKGRNLIVKVEYARRYARLIFNQDLHHRLLKEVLAAPAESEGFTLANTIAKQQAKELLASEADYF